MLYLALKAIHVVAVVLFLGNIAVGLFWKRLADRSGIAAVIEHTARGNILADRLLTIPSIVAVVVAGFALAAVGGFSVLRTGWLLWGTVLFGISGLTSISVSRAQVGLRDTASTGLTTSAQKELCATFSRRLDVWGAISLLLPAASLALMIMKPPLPAFQNAAASWTAPRRQIPTAIDSARVNHRFPKRPSASS